MIRLRRTLPVLIVVLAIAAAVIAIVQLRKRAPPEPARLLPGADGFFYVNLRWIRTVNATNQLPPVSHDPDYQKFVQDTGFDFEKDLEEAACAVHYPQAWGNGTGTGGSAPEPRFSWVFVARIDAAKLTAYLKKMASSVDNYKGFDIYSIPLEDRTLRVVLLAYDKIAVSNHPNENVIRGILDRSRKLASPFGGPQFLRKYYPKVPSFSLSWAVLNTSPQQQALAPISPWTLLLPKPAVLVVSARYTLALHLRAEAFAENEADAQQISERASTFLNLFHSAEISVGPQGPDADVKAFFESLKVEQSGHRAILTATVPPGFIKKVLTEAPTEQGPTQASPPAVPPKALPQSKRQ